MQVRSTVLKKINNCPGSGAAQIFASGTRKEKTSSDPEAISLWRISLWRFAAALRRAAEQRSQLHHGTARRTRSPRQRRSYFSDYTAGFHLVRVRTFTDRPSGQVLS